MNCFKGLTGTYIIYDPDEDKLGLPTGKYDVPLMITDKMYTDSGDLASVANESEDFVGDIMEVNGQPWPYLEVEPRKYRLRLYNTATSRPLDLHVEQSNGDWLDFQVIASDSGLFGSPVNSNDVTMGMAERYEIVVDFSTFANQNLTLKNAFTLSGPGYPQFDNMDLVMSFVVGNTVSDWSSNDVPSTLNPSINWPEARDQVDHTFRFQRGGGMYNMIMILEKSVANLLKTMYGQSTALISTMSTTAYLRDRPRAQLNAGDWSMPEVQDIIQSMFTL
jgi:bilirubin oxidase